MNSFGGKILIIRGGAIGDFILTLPAIAAVRHQFPRARVEVLGYPHIVQLAVAGGLADLAHPIEARALAGFFARGGALAEDWVDFFSEFDLIISYLYDPDEIFQTNVRLCTRAQFIAGPHRPGDAAKVHAAKVFLQPLERIAIFDADPIPKLSVAPGISQGPVAAGLPCTPPQAQAGAKPNPNLVALHPGSGSESKNWPEANWAELLLRLVNETHFALLLVGGDAEGDRLQRLAATLPPTRTQVALNLPLVDLARRLSDCYAFVGHDSGISHLAAALGLPGVLLWGDTDQEIWRPPSARVFLLRHPAGLSRLTVSTTRSALGSHLNI